jgi:hypothetical protein
MLIVTVISPRAVPPPSRSSPRCRSPPDADVSFSADAVGALNLALPVAQYDVFTSLGTWVDVYITSISSGPFAGSYAYLGRWTYELIVFRIR